jgi:hypothetical protein
MKRALIVLIVVAVSPTGMCKTYLVEWSEDGIVYDANDVQLDTTAVQGSVTLDVEVIQQSSAMGNNSVHPKDKSCKALRVSIEDVHVDYVSGEGILAAEAEVREAMKMINSKPSSILRQKFILCADGRVTISVGNIKEFTGDSWESVQEMWPNLVREAGSIGVMIPADYIRRVSWIVDVPKDIRVGDCIGVPFRKPRRDTSFSSEERTTTLICTHKTDSAVTLESNREKHSGEWMLTWHVEVEYDLKNGMPARIIDKRLRRLIDREGNTHTSTL